MTQIDDAGPTCYTARRNLKTGLRPMPDTIPPMDPDEIKQARRKLGLTGAELAHILGITPVTLRRYEMDPTSNNARTIHPTCARVIRWLLEGWRPPEWPTGKS